MQWKIQGTINEMNGKSRIDQIIASVLHNRGLSEKAVQQEFLHPKDPLALTIAEVGIDVEAVKTVMNRLGKAITDRQPIIIYGDYDADGVTATAILWETLHVMGARVFPFIPSREEHGYGLSVKGLAAALELYKSVCAGKKPLLITVDNGIVAFAAIEHVQTLGLELVITDHHQKGKEDPKCLALIHTTKISGSGVAWMLAKELQPENAVQTLELAAVGTVADMLPLKGANRAIVKKGLEVLSKSKRPGIKALLTECGIAPGSDLSTYHVSFLLAPRINAMGRLTHAIDSLRLLCTTSEERAYSLAHTLGTTNRTRQDLTSMYIEKAKLLVGESYLQEHVLVLDDAEFHEGVIGLVAGKLVEAYSRPSIVIKRGETLSKASARSVLGVNIIDLIRNFEEHLVNAGGHPMAAGFTIETEKIGMFKEVLQAHARQTIAKELLVPMLGVDCEIGLDDVTDELWSRLEELKPFGIGNPQPVFAFKNVQVLDAKILGREMQHLKLKLKDSESMTIVTALAFNQAKAYEQLEASGSCSVAGVIDENVWNGHRELQLKVKDILV